MIPLTGYADRLSARPEEAIDFRISSAADAPYEAHLVRITCGDPNPAGPGRIETDLGNIFSQSFQSRVQTHDVGSFAEIPADVTPEGTVTFEAVIWPTTPALRRQGVLSAFDPETGTGFALCLGDDGATEAVVGHGGNVQSISTQTPVAERQWVKIWATFDPSNGGVTVGQKAVGAPFDNAAEITMQGQTDAGALTWPQTLHLAALGRGTDGKILDLYNGKIESPTIRLGDGTPFASWDFSRNISSQHLHDTGSHGLHGQLVNMPSRAMTGASWTGEETCWRHAPDQYGAIHFHDSDLIDCGWETDFTFTVPRDLPSGVYGMRLTSDAGTDTIPFFVPPPKGTRTADLCVLMSTLTYVVYGNFERPDFDDSYRAHAEKLGMQPYFPTDHPEYAYSTYNFHSDGSGICHSSHLRPMMTFRPGFLNQVDPDGSGLRHFAADTHILAWLEREGISYDIVTDHDLDDEGVDLISGYRAVMTCSHPEYHTGTTLDALLAYRNGGGRFMYMGGNGFYWRVARHPELPEAVEIRRGEGGIRAWASEPGEYYNAFDGAYGGLWRRQGRPPQALAGVGFSAQGTFEGSRYRVLDSAHDPRAAWIFDGVALDDGAILGDFGLSGGGAAGFELDRADRRLGTPDHALILARSEGHSDNFVVVHEEQLTHLRTWPGEPKDDLIRAEIVFFETPAGGAVFSTGSITFCGSLPTNDFDNNVAQMMSNVVRRFLDPQSFEMPD